MVAKLDFHTITAPYALDSGHGTLNGRFEPRVTLMFKKPNDRFFTLRCINLLFVDQVFQVSYGLPDEAFKVGKEF